MNSMTQSTAQGHFLLQLTVPRRYGHAGAVEAASCAAASRPALGTAAAVP